MLQLFEDVNSMKIYSKKKLYFIESISLKAPSKTNERLLKKNIKKMTTAVAINNFQ